MPRGGAKVGIANEVTTLKEGADTQEDLPPQEGCCGKICGAPNPDHKFAEAQTTVIKKRVCRDVCCIPIFFVFCAAWVAVLVICYMNGEPARLVYATDYLGDTCGGENHLGDMKIYYPRLAEDSLLAIQSGDPTKIEMYGLCQAECPQSGAVSCSYAMEKNIQISATKDGKVDAAKVIKLRAQMAFMRDDCWNVFLPTKDSTSGSRSYSPACSARPRCS